MQTYQALMLIALLSACQTQETWTKSGSTPQDLVQDDYACDKDTRQSGGFAGGVDCAMGTNARPCARDFYNKCMVAHGWTLQQ